MPRQWSDAHFSPRDAVAATEPALSANTSAPTSQFEAASPVVALVTLDDVLAEVDQALADIDAALAASEDNR